MPSTLSPDRFNRVAAATHKLVRRFGDRRPLRGGSLLVTMFGDAIAPRGGVITLGSLIRLAAPFGLTERLVRTSVARLAKDDWLIARRAGRRSEYRLTANGQRQFAEATRRIYGESPASWDKHWTVLVLPPKAGTDRDRRNRLRWLGFGQISQGVFVHPDGNLARAQGWHRDLGLGSGTLILRSSSQELTVDRRLAAYGWDLVDLKRRYQRFVAAFAPLGAALPRALAPVARASTVTAEAAFVIRTLLIHDYRKIHLQDPLLPPALLPDNWVGTTAFDLCASLYANVFEAAESFLSGTASTLNAPLPAATPATYARFGGIRKQQSAPGAN
jgi:phenylacetic acid degradation operon negative regulatory protein